MSETKNINCVWNLKLLNNVKENTPVRCQMPDGTKRDVTYQYYVEAGNCYFFISNKEVKGYDGTSNVCAILEDINVERQDDCWDGYRHDDLFNGSNSFYDCSFYLAEPTNKDADFGGVYDIVDTKISDEEVLFILKLKNN